VLHYEGRWSNGPLWVEYLSQRLGFPYNPSNNFAHSGAQCDDTFRQVTNFIPAVSLERALGVVWAGGNDFLQNYDQLWFDNQGWSRQLAYSVGSLSNAVIALHDKKGVRFILVPNTADITEIPSINYLPSLLRDYLRERVRQFNADLATALQRVQSSRPALTLFHLDVFGQLKFVMRRAEWYGFTEINIDALADVRLLDKSFTGPGANYLFWDPIHPTTKAHALIADWFQAAVAPMSPRLALSKDAHAAPSRLSATNLHVSKIYLLQRSVQAPPFGWQDVLSFTSVTASASLPVGSNNTAGLGFWRLRW
jgi:phospholipase/lecithinase/hemolysin